MPMLRAGVLYRNPYCSRQCSLQRSSNVLSSNVPSIIADSDALNILYTVLRVRDTRNLSAYCTYPNIRTKINVHLYPCEVMHIKIDPYAHLLIVYRPPAVCPPIPRGYRAEKTLYLVRRGKPATSSELPSCSSGQSRARPTMGHEYHSSVFARLLMAYIITVHSLPSSPPCLLKVPFPHIRLPQI